MLGESHEGLGIFGDTDKAARVVPLKAAMVTSCGRALVTRDGPAAREALGDAAVLVPPADAAALAGALVRLRDDRASLDRLAAAGRRRYEERFTPRAAAARLVAALEPLLTRRGA
jgi:glycosyltransferase involved in cell wall biosynthesis